MLSDTPKTSFGMSDEDRLEATLRGAVGEEYRKELEKGEDTKSVHADLNLPDQIKPESQGIINFNHNRIDEKQSIKFFQCNEHDLCALDNVLSNLQIPKVGPYQVISISGGTEEVVSFDNNLKRNLLSDLKQIFSNEQRTLILTSGVDRGVVHYVGEALKSLEWDKKRTTMCLGLLTEDSKGLFKAVEGRDGMILRSVRGGYLEGSYANIVSSQHTHFLIIDSDSQDFWFKKGRVIRQQLEEYLAKHAFGDKDRSIVLLCVGGGVETIKEIADCLRCEYPIPVVLFKGSGGATDFVDYVTSKGQELIHLWGVSKEKVIQKFRGDLYERVKSKRGKLSEGVDDDVIEDITTILENSKSLSFYDHRTKVRGVTIDDLYAVTHQTAETPNVLNNSLGAKEFILKAISRAKLNRKLKVCGTGLSISNALASQGEEQLEPMWYAFRTENVGSIAVFIDEGFVAADEINKKVDEERRQTKDATEHGKRDQRQRVDPQRLLKKFIDKYNKKPSRKDKDDITQTADDLDRLSFRNIFLWAIETQRFVLAEFAFSRMQEDVVIATLVVSIAFKTVADKMSSRQQTEREKYMKLSSEYETKATRLIEIANREDQEKVENILLQRHKYWRNFTCLEVAIRGEAKLFLSLDCCQTTLRKQWYGHIDTTHTEKRVSLTTPIYWLIAHTGWIKLDVSENTESQMREPMQDTKDADRSTKQPEQDTGVMIASKSEYTRPERQSQSSSSANVTTTDRNKVFNYFKKCKAFYSSPIAKFTAHFVSYVMFLLLYAYVLTFCQLDHTFTPADIITHVWMMAILTEITRAMFYLYRREENFSRKKHIKEWTKFTWNRLAMVTIMTSLAAFLCRWFTATRLLARVFYGVNYPLFAFRILRLYAATKLFGPLVSMIKHMLFTTFRFTVIFMVFLIGYGVAIQALVGEHSGEEVSIYAVRDIFYKPYFQVFGELFLDDIPGAEEDADEDAPSTVTSFLYTCFLAVYLFMGNVLLLNLIIAIFSYDIQRVNEKSVEIWKFEKYILHIEFMKRSTLPEPLSLIEYLYLLGDNIVKKLKESNCARGNVNYDDSTVNSKDTLNQEFVTHCLSCYVRDEEHRKLFSVEAKTGRLERTSGYIREQNQTIIESAKKIKHRTRKLKQRTGDIKRNTSRLVGNSKKTRESAGQLLKCQQDLARKMHQLEGHLKEWEGTRVHLPTSAETQDVLVSKVAEAVVTRLSQGMLRHSDVRPTVKSSAMISEDSGSVPSPGFKSHPLILPGEDSVFAEMSSDDASDINSVGGRDSSIAYKRPDVETTSTQDHQ
ncbi:transient receptor potential cation channel subfamily M member 5-like isoform X3 [Ptychodera flava]|uniref:transient receptor potential cation channel subfamily M member 5-like isoform X3 n=1 Tax=Ptychodera flava TaxID=63121 RepID=UPI00396A3EB1